MPFKRIEEKKGLALPGLIDIIFLLLIFALVTLSITNSELDNKEQGEHVAGEVDLPFAESLLTIESDATLSTLLFQVEKVDKEDPNSLNVVYALVPDYGDTTTLNEALDQSIQDSLFAVYPENFLDLDDREFSRLNANRLIRSSVRTYKDNYFHQPSWTNSIEIRAAKETEFRIIQYILNTCSAYGDTIPQVVLHTLTGEDINYAIF